MPELDGTPQRPMRVWLQGIELGLAGFRKLVAMTTVLGFIGLLPTLYMSTKIGTAEISPESMLQLLKQGHFILSMLLVQLLVLVLTLFMNALVIQRLDQVARGVQRTGELSFILHKLPALVMAGILGFLTLMVGALLSVIIGAIIGAVAGMIFGHAAAMLVTEACVFIALIYIAIYIMFFQFAIVLDDKGPVSALNRSCALVFHNWWRTFWVLLYTVLIIIGILLLVVLPLALVAPLEHWISAYAAADTGRTLLVKGVVRLVATALLAPFLVGIVYVMYHDLKARHAARPTPTGVVQA